MAEMFNVIVEVYGVGQTCSFEDRDRARLFAQDLAGLDSVGGVVVTEEFRQDEKNRPMKIFDSDERCGAESPSGRLVCTRPWGHTDGHEAAAGEIEWERSDDDSNPPAEPHTDAETHTIDWENEK